VIIFGFRTKVHQLAMLTMICAYCGNTAAQALTRRTTRFTLFFIPLFPVRRSTYHQQCTFCGTESALTAEDAQRLTA
jgi:hypothetical protein